MILSTLSTHVFSFINRTAYRKDLMMILLVTVIGLFLIWFFFFANPIDHRLTTNQITDRYISSIS